MDHLQIAVALSMAGAFLLGTCVKSSWIGALCYARGRADMAHDLGVELADALTPDELAKAGAL